MRSLIPSLNAGRGGAPGLAAALTVFIAGLVVGLGFSPRLGGQFAAGLVILSILCGALALLQRVTASSRRRITAGEADYRAFFDHAVDGIFRTTPDGRYLDTKSVQVAYELKGPGKLDQQKPKPDAEAIARLVPDLPPVVLSVAPDSGLVLVETSHRVSAAAEPESAAPTGPRRTRKPRPTLVEEPLEIVETRKDQPPAS